ncbi:Bicyclomycin resistance protein [Tsuneonella dongtanensis]|uniref:Bcr/CflA family efflux transporter n=1 Tax=Tsuneonella dongtanensis TaxID=692370 RepID=A0A1B2AGL7_9SPHN|nr:multidrug effflux MFS transporter [Tsuneonella dongtanensis]ANY21280.1 Bicyclomycin resistance protein [Tsuneonella dongtanensis]
MNGAIHASHGRERSIGRAEFVALMAAIMSLGALAIDGMLPALDEIAATFGVDDPNRRQLVVGVYLLAGGVGCLVPGSLSDRFGRRPLLFAAFGFYVVTSLLCAIAPSYDALLALRVIQGLGTAGLGVIPAAIIRDRFEGDAMARLMSTIFIVFMVVPVLAPTFGQAILTFADWPWVFVGMAALAALVASWTWARLPETLAAEDRQPLDFRSVAQNLPLTFRTREAIGYVLGSGLVFGAMFGYINSSQQLVGEHFGAGDDFPFIFGATASTLAVSSFLNSRIVEKFGARRVSHSALVIFIVVSAAQVWASLYRGESLELFVPLMAANLCLLGFMGANFGSIAMQPFSETAGAASSAQAFVRMSMGAILGIAIGQLYDDSARPMAFALLTCSLLSLTLVLFSERGVLFRRPRDARKYLAAHGIY